ncbi:hypothetical protein C1864_02010 [Eggerthella lenta]|uniref:hypothetical protein n=1 Tax=Eggerthella lenta TaxID=84112 RepID=UPI000DF77AC9|nr:hypothetical protein [Eggerthella lenta]RDC07166.1 hypothetical protein C1864_02010 [Eggerthella lenta]
MNGLVALLNPVLVQHPFRRAIDLNLIYGAQNALVEADNGVGKTSTIIDAALSVFDSDYVLRGSARGDDQGRVTTAQAMMESGCGHISVTMLDFLLEDSRIVDGNDMVLVGKVIDNNDYGTNPLRAKEHSLRFIMHHSSEIYDRMEDPGFLPYEELGLRFTEWPEGRAGKPLIRPFKDVREDIQRLAAGRDDYCRYTSYAQSGEFIERVREETGFDAARYLSIFGSILNTEGLSKLEDLKAEQFNERMVYEPLTALFLDAADADGKNVTVKKNCLDLLVSFVEKDSKKTVLRDAYAWLLRKIDDSDKLKAKFDALKSAEDAAAAAQGSIDGLYGNAVANAERARADRGQVKRKIAELEDELADLEHRKCSREVIEAEDVLDMASKALDTAQSGASRAESEMKLADFEWRRADWLVAARDAETARGRRDAAQESLNEKKRGAVGTRADDLAWTLHDSHGTRMAAAKEALDAATAKRTELTAERDAASTAKIAATKELSGAFRAEASGEARRDSAFDAAAAQLKDYIDASAVDKKNKMISLPDTEAAVAAVAAALDAAATAKAGAAASLAKAKSQLEDARTERRDAAAEDDRAKAARANAQAAKARIDDARAACEGHEGLAAPTSADGAERTLADAEAARVEAVDAIDGYRREIDGRTRRLDAAAAGELFLPEQVVEMLDRAGIRYAQNGELYLTQLAKGVDGTRRVEDVLERIPYLASSIIVDDGDLERFRRQIAAAPDDLWFAGTVPVVPASALDGGEVAPVDMIAHREDGYLLNPAAFEESLRSEITGLESKVSDREAELAGIEAFRQAVDKFAARLDAEGVDSVDVADSAAEAACAAAIAAATALAEAEKKGELAGVAKPESGNLVQGSFDRLLAEYFELMQQIGAEVGALQKALNEAETEYAEAKESARGKRAEAEKRLRAYCEPFADIDAEARVAESLAEDAPVPTRKQVDALAEARTAANDAFKAADLAKARAQIEKDDAGKKLDGALAALRERCGEKAAIVREPESLVGDFTKKISEANGRHRALEKEISALASLEEGCGKAAECARRRGSAAIAHPELTRPIVDLEAYRREIGRSGDELARAKAAREKSRAGYADAVKAFADTSEASDAMLAETPKAAAAMREHADGVADFIAGRTTLDMAGKTLEKAAGVLNASAAGVKGNLDFNDESLDTAISNLLDVANESIGYLRGLEKSSGGDLEIPCCHRRPPRAEYDARFRDGVRETLVRMSASVGKRDGGLASCRDEISRELEQDVVSIKSLIARHIDIVQGRGVPFSMKFTSPRLGEAKKLTWNELRGLSGGEKAQVFFLICSLLAQTAVEGDPATHRAFLLMDNPFANLSNEERLDYCMDVATANNVQIVATKQLGAAIPILDSFDYRYMLHGYRAASAPVVTIESERTTVPDSSLSVMVARSISLRGHAGTARLPLDV